MKKGRKLLLIAAVLALTAFLIVLPNMELFRETVLPDFESPAENVVYEDTGAGSSPYKYYVNQLNDDQKEAYYAVLNHIDEMPEKIRIPKLSGKELNELFSALTLDNPRLFCIGSKCTIISVGSLSYFKVDYTMSPEDYRRALAETDARADAVIASLTSPADQWQTEREVHDAIIAGAEYLFEEDNDDCASAYGALVQGKASCEGYSRALKFILDKAGIESHLISGTGTDAQGESGSHMWNAVRINGVWCHLDVTWDDPVGGAYTDYSYFNVTDEEINLDHSDWHFAHKCISNSQSYYYSRCLYCTEWNGRSVSTLAGPIGREITAGCRAVTLKFADEAAYRAALSALFEREAVYDLMAAAADYTPVHFSVISLQYSKNDTKRTVTLVPEF